MKIYPILYCYEMKIQIMHMCQETLTSCLLVPPFIMNKHIYPFGMSNNNPKYQYYITSVTQLLFSILRKSVTISSKIPVRKVPYHNLYLKYDSKSRIEGGGKLKGTYSLIFCEQIKDLTNMKCNVI